MKLWYQSMTDLRAWPAYERALTGQLDRIKDPGTTIAVHGMTKIGGIGDQYRYLEFLETNEVLENVHRAIDEGFDAFLIGNIGEPGLRIAREVADFPVLGLCEAACHMACMMGGSFSFVTVNEKFTPRIIENVQAYGLLGRLAGADNMDVPRLLDLGGGFESREGRARLEGAFERAAATGIARGSEIVIPAGGVVMALLAAWDVHQTAAGVPILNGITNLVKMGEMAVRMKRLTGAFTSKRGMYAPPPSDQIEELRRCYGAGIYPGIATPNAEQRKTA